MLSLDELRRYIRLFWTDPEYGLCTVPGAFTLFRQTCQLHSVYFRKLFLDVPPQMEFLAASRQRLISRAVLNVLSGRIHYEPHPTRLRRAIGVYDAQGAPPAAIPPLRRDVQFALRSSALGPRVYRIPN